MKTVNDNLSKSSRCIKSLVKNFRFDASNAWGHINIFAKGAGHAVAQLDVNYGVDYEPFKVNSFIS